MKGWGVLLLVTALAAAAVGPASATARPGHDGARTRTHAKFRVQGTNGFGVEVDADFGAGSTVVVTATSKSASVNYGLVEPPSKDRSLGTGSSLDVHLPHVGRIAVQFVPAKTVRRRPTADCTGQAEVVERGYFRGTIELHGERGYTTVDRKSARGTLTRTLPETCGEGAPERGRSTTGSEKDGAVTLVAGAPNGLLSLVAMRGSPGPGDKRTFVLAGRTRFRGGMIITNSAFAMAEPDVFDAPGPGEPKVAELAPPAPFEGSARFELTSPKTSTWRGDLAVDLPGIGRTRLAGPSFESTLCLSSHCTDTVSETPGLIAVGVGGLFE